MKKIRVMSVFSGVGGLEQGLNNDQFEIVGHSEINKHACSILKYHYPNIPNFGDISKIDTSKLPQYDMLVGGSPCQNLSMAGNKKGLAGTKSSLFFIFAKLLKENNPDYFIWENVKGTYYSNDGLDFIAVQKAFLECGYHFQWQLLNAEDFGVAQVRNRVFVVGSKNPDHLPGLLDIVRNSTQKQSNLKFTHFCGSLIVDGSVQTITASYGPLSGNGTKIFVNDVELSAKKLKESVNNNEQKIRLITPNEGEKLMSWGKDWTKFGVNEKNEIIEISDRERYRAIGNGIVSNCVKFLMQNFKKSKKEFILNKSKKDLIMYIIPNELIEEHNQIITIAGLVENEDFLRKGNHIYLLNTKLYNSILENEFFKKNIKIKHPYNGILINGVFYSDNTKTTHYSIKSSFKKIADKEVLKKYFLDSKQNKYLLKRLK